MIGENNLCLLLIFGSVSLATSESKVYYLSKDGLTSFESNNPVDSQELQSNDEAIRLLAQLFRSKPAQSAKNSKNIPNNVDYDYDGYYRDYTNQNKLCEGDKCLFLIPGKAPYLTKKSDSDASEDITDPAYLEDERKEDSKDHDSGYDRDDEGDDRDDEGDENEVQIKRESDTCSTNMTRTNCYRNSTTTEPTTPNVTPKRHKTLDEKTTDEITSSDMDAIIPESFEQRADKDDGQRKFSTDYIDMDNLYETMMPSKRQSNKNSDQVKSFSNDYLDINDLYSTVMRAVTKDDKVNIPKVYPKEFLRELRRPRKTETREGGRKWGTKKSTARKKQHTTPPSVDSSSDSDTSNIPAEDSDTERDSESQSSEVIRPTRPNKQKSNRFKVVNQKPDTSLSKENEFLTEDSLETIEAVSVEAKPTPKKKSKLRLPGKPEHYIQSFSRLYKEGKDFRKKKEDFDNFLLGLRRRLPQFLPKRYHWDPSEFQQLGYFWFNGPQGKSPGPWRIAY